MIERIFAGSDPLAAARNVIANVSALRTAYEVEMTREMIAEYGRTGKVRPYSQLTESEFLEHMAEGTALAWAKLRDLFPAGKERDNAAAQVSAAIQLLIDESAARAAAERIINRRFP